MTRVLARLVLALVSLTHAAHGMRAGLAGCAGTSAATARCAAPAANIFEGLFQNFGDEEEKERAYQEQLEVLARRKDPKKYFARLRETEERRAKESIAYQDKFSWQQSADPLKEFKKRQKAGKVKKLGYEDVPKGGLQLPMASFGVGGEFGQGGKYDNGERFDIRLPYVDKGWVDDSPKKPSAFSRLGSGYARAKAGQKGQKPKQKPAARPARPARGAAKTEPPPPSSGPFGALLDGWIKATTQK